MCERTTPLDLPLVPDDQKMTAARRSSMRIRLVNRINASIAERTLVRTLVFGCLERNRRRRQERLPVLDGPPSLDPLPTPLQAIRVCAVLVDIRIGDEDVPARRVRERRLLGRLEERVRRLDGREARRGGDDDGRKGFRQNVGDFGRGEDRVDARELQRSRWSARIAPTSACRGLTVRPDASTP